jgi:hypothetical protein
MSQRGREVETAPGTPETDTPAGQYMRAHASSSAPLRPLLLHLLLYKRPHTINTCVLMSLCQRLGGRLARYYPIKKQEKS